jgi:hypothetical protein
LVRGTVEVIATDEFDYICDGVLAQQHRTENRLLGRGIIWWGSVRLNRAFLGHGEFRDAHALPLPIKTYSSRLSPCAISNPGM